MAGPGSQGQVIDYNLMYKAGQAVAPGHRRYKQQQTPWLAKAAFNIIGGEVLSYIRDTKARRRSYADKNALFDSTIANSIAEDKGMSEIYADAAQEFSAVRDEGQRLVAKYHGFPNSKKYKKGVALMNKAQSSLENLQMDAQTKLTLQNQFKQIEKDGVILNGDGTPTKTQYAKYNTSKVDDRTMMFTTGELDRHFQVNPDTGHLELLEEDDSNFLKIKPEQMSDEQYNEYVENYIPEVKTTTFGDIQFNKFQDDTALGLLSESRTNGISYGDTGIEWDGTLETGLYADARTKVNQLTPAQFKSWFFSGTNYNFANSGKTFMTPAEEFLSEQYPDMEPGSPEYIGAMEQLKEQDLSDGNEYKEYAVKQMMDVTKQFYDVSKNAYDKKHKKVVTQGKDTRKNISVDGVSTPPYQAEVFASQMMQNKPNTQYGGDGRVYKNDGKGMTTVWEYQPIYKVVKDEEGNDIEIETGKTKLKQVIEDPIPTAEALKMRGLGGWYTGGSAEEWNQTSIEEASKHLNLEKKSNKDEFRFYENK